MLYSLVDGDGSVSVRRFIADPQEVEALNAERAQYGEPGMWVRDGAELDLLFADVETGGTEAYTDALLEVALWRAAPDGVPSEAMSCWKVSPEGRKMHAAALRVNGIVVAQHLEDPTLKGREVVAREMYTRYGNATKEVPRMLVGWNVGFDHKFLTVLLEQYSLPVCDVLGSYRVLDLHGMMSGLACAGLMPYTYSLEQTAQYFGLLTTDQKQAHSAASDLRLTVAVFRALRRMVIGSQAGEAFVVR